MVMMAMMGAVMMVMMGDEFDALIRSSLSNFSPLQLFIWVQSLLCYCVKLQFREEWQCRQGRHSWALFCFEGFPVHWSFISLLCLWRRSSVENSQVLQIHCWGKALHRPCRRSVLNILKNTLYSSKCTGEVLGWAYIIYPGLDPIDCISPPPTFNALYTRELHRKTAFIILHPIFACKGRFPPYKWNSTDVHILTRYIVQLRRLASEGKSMWKSKLGVNQTTF